MVPLAQMMQYGVDATLERVHPRNRGLLYDTNGDPVGYDAKWGAPAAPVFGDARDAGLSNDGVSWRPPNGAMPNGAIPNEAAIPETAQDPAIYRDTLPLFSEARSESSLDTDRNPYMMYQPMTRLGNLVTESLRRVRASGLRSATSRSRRRPIGMIRIRRFKQSVRDHFGGDITLYNRVYPDGYMLGREVGSDTGDVKRPRGFYIIDRTEEVGFKPGEDLNVEKTDPPAEAD